MYGKNMNSIESKHASRTAVTRRDWEKIVLHAIGVTSLAAAGAVIFGKKRPETNAAEEPEDPKQPLTDPAPETDA